PRWINCIWKKIRGKEGGLAPVRGRLYMKKNRSGRWACPGSRSVVHGRRIEVRKVACPSWPALALLRFVGAPAGASPPSQPLICFRRRYLPSLPSGGKPTFPTRNLLPTALPSKATQRLTTNLLRCAADREWRP